MRVDITKSDICKDFSSRAVTFFFFPHFVSPVRLCLSAPRAAGSFEYDLY